MNRLGYLDGLRGLLALIVFGEHFLKAFYPTAITHETIRHNGSYLDLTLIFSPLTYLYNGAFAVAGFFVLSGYLLMRSVWYSDNKDRTFHIQQIGRRYFRFAVPISVSLLFVLITGQLGLLNYDSFIQETGSNLKNIYPNQDPIFLGDVLVQGFGTSLFAFDYRHNPVLWMMTPEMFAVITFGVFGSILNNFASSQVTRAMSLLAFLSVSYFIVSGYLFVGIWIGALIFGIDLLWHRFTRNHWLVALGFFTVGAVLLLSNLKGGASNPFVVGKGSEHASNIAYTLYGIAWGGLLLGLLHLPALQDALSNKSLQSLGKSSFGIYLFHYPLLGMLAVPIVNTFSLPWGIETLLAGVATLAASYLIGLVSYRWIERPIIKAKSIKFQIKYDDYKAQIQN